MWHVPVVWCISTVAQAAVLSAVVEARECDDSGTARGWLLDRLRRYPPGHEGRLLACLERYTSHGSEPRPLDADAPMTDPVRAAPVPGALLTLAGDCHRVGSWVKGLADTRLEWLLARDLRGMAMRLGEMAELWTGVYPVP